MASLKMELKLVGLIRNAEVEGVFVTQCPRLAIFSQGRNEEEAKQALRSAITLWLGACFERGLLDRVLLDSGFMPTPKGHVPPADCESITVEHNPDSNSTEFPVHVPFELLAARAAEARA